MDVGAVGRTSRDYRLYALPDTVPPKPGLLRVSPAGGAEIDIEVWSMGVAEFGGWKACLTAYHSAS
jgi:allophanate hydrolase